MTKDDLIAFEQEVVEHYKAKRVKGPIHLSGGNEDRLIDIFKGIWNNDYVFSTYRSHYHALLHGIPRDWLMSEILAGRSMGITSPSHNFYSSAIVGGMLPIAVGVAYALKKRGPKMQRVWCFIGDMAATTGAYHEAIQYSLINKLPIRFIIEDNGLSCDTPTEAAWGGRFVFDDGYKYERTFPHSGVGHDVF